MKYDLITPCAHCPFRNDIDPFITPGRLEEILYQEGEFACHKTVDYDDDDMEGIVGEDSQHCAGLLILREKEEAPNQMMRIAERLGMYDASKLNMDAPVYDDYDSALCAHEEAQHE